MSNVEPFRFKTQEEAIRYAAREAFRQAPIIDDPAVIHGAATGLIAGLFGDADHAEVDLERWVNCAKAEYANCIQKAEG